MGIDLASKPANTAVCILGWRDRQAEVITLCRGQADHKTKLHTKWLSTTAYGSRGDYGGPITKVGIDAPFGWPEPFLDAVVAYREGPSWPTGLGNDLQDCRMRRTDLVVQERADKWPLSVSADSIAMCAMRCATLLTHIAEQTSPAKVERDGSGLCCEVYPDPAIRHWTDGSLECLAKRESYKGKERGAKRGALLAALQAQLTLKDPGGLLGSVVLEDDYLDALVCALVARAVERELTHLPETEADRASARAEGWIHLPASPLEALAA